MKVTGDILASINRFIDHDKIINIISTKWPRRILFLTFSLKNRASMINETQTITVAKYIAKDSLNIGMATSENRTIIAMMIPF